MENTKRIHLLSSAEVKELYALPAFHTHEQRLYFTLNQSERAALASLFVLRRTDAHDVQTGYVRRVKMTAILDRGKSTQRLLRAIYAGIIPVHCGRRPEELIAISGSLTLPSNTAIAWMTLHMQQVIDR